MLPAPSAGDGAGAPAAAGESGVLLALAGMGTRPTSPAPAPALPPEGDPVGSAVTNVTCGTATAVVTTPPPDAVRVYVNVTVVTGTATFGLGGLLAPTLGLGPRPLPFVCVAVTVAVTSPVSVSVSVSVDGVGAGVGTSVMVVGTPVQIPGFWGTKSAQMPARYDSAAVTLSSEPPHEDTQACTLAMNSGDGQKQLASLLDLQCGIMPSQVLRQLGRTGGQGAGICVCGGEGGGMVEVDEELDAKYDDEVSGRGAGVVVVLSVKGGSVADDRVDGGGRLQRVQTVDVEVMVTVEMVCVVSVMVSLPVVRVCVMGQVERVVTTISVVITSVYVVDVSVVSGPVSTAV